MLVAFIVALLGINSLSASALIVELEKNQIVSSEPLNHLNALVINDQNISVAIHVYTDQRMTNNLLVSRHQLILAPFESTRISIQWVGSKKLNQSIQTTVFFEQLNVPFHKAGRQFEMFQRAKYLSPLQKEVYINP